MDQLREEIEQGSYRVDPKAVADAIVLRLLGLAGQRRRLGSQSRSERVLVAR